MSADLNAKKVKAKAIKGLSVLIGVSGSIAAYKSAELVRAFQKEGADVKVVMTKSASNFISPLTFSVLTGKSTATGFWEDSSRVDHIELAKSSDLLVIAPATAATIARCAHGLSDDLLSAIFLASDRVVIAPAMNERMLLNPATQENIKVLKSRGVVFLECGSGDLACGEGVGRLAEIDAIVNACRDVVDVSGLLAGKKAVVTAGPTREMIDDVRFISNRSSGQMGFAIAEALARMSADVTLIAGPTSLEAPKGVTRKDIIGSEDLRHALLRAFKNADIVVMAAAIADFRPAMVSTGKIKKAAMPKSIKLEKAPDILAELGAKKKGQFIIGFALESTDMVNNAKVKLEEKNLDMIIANEISAMESDESHLIVLFKNGKKITLPKRAKKKNAEAIAKAIAETLNAGEGG